MSKLNLSVLLVPFDKAVQVSQSPLRPRFQQPETPMQHWSLLLQLSFSPGTALECFGYGYGMAKDCERLRKMVGKGETGENYTTITYYNVVRTCTCMRACPLVMSLVWPLIRMVRTSRTGKWLLECQQGVEGPPTPGSTSAQCPTEVRREG